MMARSGRGPWAEGALFHKLSKLSIHKLALAGVGGGAGGALASALGAARLVTEESERIERAMIEVGWVAGVE